MSPSKQKPAAKAAAKRKPKRRSLLWRWRRFLFLAALVLVAAVAGAGYVLSSIPLPPEEIQAETSFLYDAAGNQLAELHGEIDRTNVRLDDVPQVLVDAVLAAEDKDFFEHNGIDPLAIVRATYNDLRDRSQLQGGSTITQQYVKNVYLTRERTLSRKIKEAVLAVKIERELDKRQILERYLNTIYFGRGAYGVQSAAQAYFDKDVSELGLPEAAYLAGLIRAPEAADATSAPAVADQRRSIVLDAMVRAGFIDGEQRDLVEAAPVASYTRQRPNRADPDVTGADIGTEYFVEYVRRYLSNKYGDAAVYGGGLRVHTTLDMNMQRAAYEAITSTLDQPDDPSAALVAIDSEGRVKAMYGGRNFREQKVNYAVGKDGGGTGRQPGSAFKPFVLAQAVHEGYTVESAFEAPGRITIPGANAGGDWKVANYGGGDKGVQNLIEATEDSTNTVYAQLIIEIGAEKVAALAKRMGIRSELPAVNSLTLGTGEVSVIDLATAYSVFANRGELIHPTVITKVETADGRILEELSPRRERILTQEAADIVTYCLRQVVERGTGTAARFGRPAAGKTGTTQNNGDAWFAGYTPALTAVVWMGYPEGQQREMDSVHGRSVTGGSFPAEMWRKFMVDATDGIDTGVFPTVRSFPGRRLNPEVRIEEETTTTSSTTTTVEETTTSSKPEPSTTTTTDDTAPSTTEPPDQSTTTTAPPPPPQSTAPGASGPPTTVSAPDG